MCSTRPCRTLPLIPETQSFRNLLSAQKLKSERLRCRGLEKENLRGSLAFMAQRITIIKGPGPRSPNRIYHRRARMAHNQTTERNLRLAQLTILSIPLCRLITLE